MRFVEVARDFVKTYPWLTAGNLAMAMMLTPIHDVLLPHLYGRLVSVIEKGEEYKPSMVYVLITVAFVQMCSFFKDTLDMETQPRLFDFVRSRMMDSLLDKYDGDLIEPPTGTVVSTIIRTPEIIAWWVECAIDVCVPYIFAFTTATLYFYYYDTWIALALLILLVALITLLVCAPLRCMNESIAREHALQSCHEQIDDTLKNVMSVYGSDTVSFELDLMSQKGDIYQAAHKKAMMCMLVYKGIGVPIVVMFFSVVVVRCCHLVATGKISKGTFVSLFMVTTSLVNTLAWMVSLVKSATLDSGTLSDSETICTKSVPDVPIHACGVIIDTSSPDQINGIQFVDVTYSHHHGLPIVKNMTYNFERHQRTLITGSVGSGKSTIVKLIMGFLQPTEGDVYISGESYSNIGLKKVRKQIAFMPQDATLFNRTVLQNILYGNHGKTEKDVRASINQLGMRDSFEGLYKGLHTDCLKGGSGLSGGQRQLVYFMRVILRDPEYIVLDEPTASMDSVTKEVLMRALDVVSRKKTLIMITHDQELMAFATRKLEW